MKDLSRRAFVGMTATATAAALAGAGTLAGCGGKREAPAPGDEGYDILSHYLPLGSVVTLRGSEPLDVKFMVVARRPNVTSVSQDDGTRTEVGYVYDYAGVQWPLGFVSDLTLQAQGAECLGFNREDVSRVDFVGWAEGREGQARDLLDASYGSMDTCASVLLPLQSDIVSRFPRPEGARS